MTEHDILVRIVLESSTKPGDLIVEDGGGNRRLFIGSTGALSRGSLNPDFFEALMRSQRWETVADDHWYSLEDLQKRFSPGRSPAERTGAHRLVAALGGRAR